MPDTALPATVCAVCSPSESYRNELEHETDTVALTIDQLEASRREIQKYERRLAEVIDQLRTRGIRELPMDAYAAACLWPAEDSVRDFVIAAVHAAANGEAVA